MDNNLVDKNNEGFQVKNESVIISEKNLADKIHTVRSQKVMLDFELAEIYGYETKRFNEQVKRNKEKFEGEDFMFRLTDDEMEELSRSHFATLNKGTGRGSNIKYNPYCFTEQGISQANRMMELRKLARTQLIALEKLNDTSVKKLKNLK